MPFDKVALAAAGAALLVLVTMFLIAAVTGRKKDKALWKGDQGADVKRSYFDGGILPLLGWHCLAGLICILSLGIAYPWAKCMVLRWETAHTVINGRRLRFTGTGKDLIWKYLLWGFLTIITLGVFGIWFGLNLKRWQVRHTVYEDGETPVESRFTGGAGGWFGNHLLTFMMTVLTLGIAFPWAHKRMIKWKTEHTNIGGSFLVFSGTGLQLTGRYLLLLLLTVLTLGIYAFLFPEYYRKWRWSHTHAMSCTPMYRTMSRSHEQTVAADAVRLRQADGETQLERVKSGITGEETDNELGELAQSGNRCAMYELSLRLKENCFEGYAQDLLRSSALAGYPPAMLEYAVFIGSGQPALYAQLLEGSAEGGDTRAPWLLKELYEMQAIKLHDNGSYDCVERLQKAAYWFRIAIELGDPSACDQSQQYEKMLQTIGLWLTERREPVERNSGTLSAALCILAIFLVLAGFAVYAFVTMMRPSENEVPVSPLVVWCDGEAVDSRTILFENVPWQPGVASYENLKLTNSSEEPMSYRITFTCDEMDGELVAVAVRRVVSSEDLENIMPDHDSFTPLRELVLEGTVEAGALQKIALIVYFPEGIGNSQIQTLQIHAQVDIS